MSVQRRLKKSEFLEVRLPHPTKQAFMARCRADGRSASEAVRCFIDGYLAGPMRRPAPGRIGRWAAAGAALLVCGLAAAPSFARTTASDDFARLDANHDGRVSLSEFDHAATVQVVLAPAPGRWLGMVGLAPAPAQPVLDARLRQEVTAITFRQMDLDRDRTVSLAEYRRYHGG